MRFRSLALLCCSGCALFDAAGDEQLVSEYRLANVPDVGGVPAMALVADADTSQGKDLVVLANREVRIGLRQPDGTFEGFEVAASGIDVIGVGNVDGTPTDEIIVAATDRLEVYTVMPGGGIQTRDLGANTIAGAVPRSITTASFPFFAPNGRSIVVTYVDRPEVRIVGNVFDNPTTRTLAVGSVGANAGEVLAANVKGATGSPDPEQLVVADGTMLLEATDNGTGEFDSIGRAIDAQAVHLAGGDFGADLATDVAFTQSDPQAGISVVYGSPSGLTVLGVTFRVIGQGLDVRELLSGRFNSDDRADLATLGDVEGGREIHLFLRANDESFIESAIPLEPDHPVNFVSAGDLDADGRDDFVLVPGKDGGVDLLLSR